jgi:ribonuclease D
MTSKPDPESPSQRRWASYRSRHRARQHDEAHANEDHTEAAIPEHPLIPRNAPGVITTQAEFDALLDHVRDAGSFAYDSEFIGEESYHPKLCVVQIATTDRVALADPLAGLDLTPLWRLIADQKVEKLVHAGLQDLEPVARLLGKPPANVFDTQIAAAFLGSAYPIALNKLVHEFAGVELGKGLKFSQWDKRPLSAVQKRYAANDVRYLPAVKAGIEERLAANGNLDWARQECDALSDLSLYLFDPAQQYLRVRGGAFLKPKQLAVLRELVAWRDQQARKLDVPPRTFLKDDVLVTMAREPVHKVEDLDRVPGLPRPVEEEHGSTLVNLTHDALKLPAAKLPARIRPDKRPSMQVRLDSLWQEVQDAAQRRHVATGIVTSRKEVEQVAYCLIRRRKPEDARLLRGWRHELLGETLERFTAQEAERRARRASRSHPRDVAPPSV